MPEDADLKSLLEKNLAATDELRREVKKITRYIWWGRVLETIKFLVVIGALAGAYFVVQPYVGRFWNLYREVVAGLSGQPLKPQQLPQTLDEVKNLLRQQNTGVQ